MMSFERLNKIMGLNEIDMECLLDYQKQFHCATYALKKVSQAFQAVEAEEDEEDDIQEEEEDDESESIDDPIEAFNHIKEATKELRNLIKEVPSVMLKKFLEMKIAHDSKSYKVIKGFKKIFEFALGIPEDEIRFRNSNLIKLYLGMPLNGIKNANRTEFINWVEEEIELEDLTEEDEKDLSDEELIAHTLSLWLVKLASLLKELRDTDLDNIKSRTFDKDNQNIRKFNCSFVNWFTAPINDDIDVLMVQLNPIADICIRTLQISIVDETVLNKFHSVQVSHLRYSTTFTYESIRKSLSQFLPIENKHYILARPLSNKSAIYCSEKEAYSDQFTNDMTVYYSLNNQEYTDVENKVKDYLFIHLSKDYMLPVVLETENKVGAQLKIIQEKIGQYNLRLKIDELKTRLLWNGKPINFDLPFSSFVSDNDLSTLGKSAPLFTYQAMGNQKPSYQIKECKKDVNLRIKPNEIMIHYYEFNFEEYKKQAFNTSIFGSKLIGFDISQFSQMFNFTDNFTINMGKVSQEQDGLNNENVYFYKPVSILTRKPDENGSQLFFYNEETKNWDSANTEGYSILAEEMSNKFVKMVFYESNEDDEEEDQKE